MSGPLRFCFGLHLHQPVGNFDSVFEDHVDHVYRPLISALLERDIAPIALHLSGPLTDWIESHAGEFLDQIGHHVTAGRIELLAAGYDEPILAVLPRDDRREQVERHREYLRRRFGADVRGLWLTERVWEPSLAEDLARAGIEFVLVDDRHFRVTGFAAAALHSHFTTEFGGHRVHAFPIDERLRYLVPFRSPEELAGYFHALRQQGAALAVLADDGEKFGGWPGTRKWVYEDGWIDRFTGMIAALRHQGEIMLSRFDEAVAVTPSGGLAYLPSASYREMEGWSLPPEPARALLRLEEEWGSERLAGVEGGLLRGGHWRHFLVKYPESNRMHKMMMALSMLCHERHEPPAARRAIGRAQCNDAYWHGVFGGLYLPHLRHAVWANLADAEAVLRQGERPTAEEWDLDADGNLEVWVRSAAMSAVVAPARGGAVEVLTAFAARQNYADALTRHREAYHGEDIEPAGTVEMGNAAFPRPEGSAGSEPNTADHPERSEGSQPPSTDAEPAQRSTPSIHDLEGDVSDRPPLDVERRAWFVDRILPPDVTLDAFVAGTLGPIHSWSPARLAAEWRVDGNDVVVTLTESHFSKELRFAADRVHCRWTWDPDPARYGAPAGSWFSTEISYAGEVTFPDGVEVWRYPIETMSKSESGFERTVQGTAAVLRWPIADRERRDHRRTALISGARARRSAPGPPGGRKSPTGY